MITALRTWLTASPGREYRLRHFREGKLDCWIYTLDDPADPGPQEFKGATRGAAGDDLRGHLEPSAQQELFG